MPATILLLLSSISVLSAVTKPFFGPSPALSRLSGDHRLQLNVAANFAAVQAALNEAEKTVAESEGGITDVEITLHGSSLLANPANLGIIIPGELASESVLLTVQSDSETVLSAGVRLKPNHAKSEAHGLLRRSLNKDGIREYSVGSEIGSSGCGGSGLFWPQSTCEGCMPAELFCEGKRLVRAQYPNRGSGRQQRWLHIQNLTQHGEEVVEIHLDPSEIESSEHVDRWWKEVNFGGNMWLHGAFFLPWADDFVRVADVKRFPHPSFMINISHTPPQYDFKLNQRFVVINSLSDLDEEGEFYLRGHSLLAILSDSCVASDSLTMTQAAHVFSSSAHLSNAVFRGLSFQHSRSAAVYLPFGASNVAFERCSFSETGTEGLRIENATSQNVVVRDSRFADTGCGGARVEGGDVRTLSGGGHVFERCGFRQPGQVNLSRLRPCFEMGLALTQKVWRNQAVMTYTPALGMTGVNHEASQCSFEDMPHMAVGKAESPSREIRIKNVNTACVGCRVTNSSFFDIAHSTTDVGAIYFAYNVLTRVTVQGCTFEKIRADRTTRTWGYRLASAIYWDLGVSYGTIIGNTFRDVDIGVIVNNGIQHSIEFNDFADAIQAVYIIHPFADPRLCSTYFDLDGTFHAQLAQVGFGTDLAWQKTYPKLAFHLNGVNCSRAASTAVPHSTVVALNWYANLSAGFHDYNSSQLRHWGVLLHSNQQRSTHKRT